MEKKTAQELSKAIGKPLVTGKTSIWLTGNIYQWSPVFNNWIRTNNMQSFRPGDIIPHETDEQGRIVAVIDI